MERPIDQDDLSFRQLTRVNLTIELHFQLSIQLTRELSRHLSRRQLRIAICHHSRHLHDRLITVQNSIDRLRHRISSTIRIPRSRPEDSDHLRTIIIPIHQYSTPSNDLRHDSCRTTTSCASSLSSLTVCTYIPPLLSPSLDGIPRKRRERGLEPSHNKHLRTLCFVACSHYKLNSCCMYTRQKSTKDWCLQEGPYRGLNADTC